MYDNTYKDLLDAEVAKKFGYIGKWFATEGNEVEKEEAFGPKYKFELTHPSYLLFVDEVQHC